MIAANWFGVRPASELCGTHGGMMMTTSTWPAPKVAGPTEVAQSRPTVRGEARDADDALGGALARRALKKDNHKDAEASGTVSPPS